ncbi:MAG: pyridoxal-phosphate dependent enzyme [Anaerolineales bacterium]|nr:pyridoxal-phosphate dependent enzyme [Anaerolineales bacterium]
MDTTLPGIWRFRHALGLPAEAPQVYLGEGNTPLIWAKVLGKDIAFKLEFLNPTGSFKDRGSAALVSFLLSRGVKTAVEDSSGNAGASYAAYAARAGIRAQVFVPDYASGPKRRQIEAYGAQVVRIPGPRSNTSEAVLRAVESGEIYASHAYMPFCLPGYATAAYEIFEQLGQAPGAVICPVGQGNLLLSIGRGFQALKKAGLVDRLPVLIGVQALACAPVWALWRYGPTGLGWVAEGETLAEGVRVKYPLRGDALLRTVEESGGMFFAVAEEDIPLGADQLARLGLYVEPTSAIVWNALQQVVEQMPGPLVVMLTGSGLKYQG